MKYNRHNVCEEAAGRGRSAAREGFAIIGGGGGNKCCQCENVANSNFQLSIGNIGIGNWQHSHTGNIPTRLPRKPVSVTTNATYRTFRATGRVALLSFTAKNPKERKGQSANHLKRLRKEIQSE